MEKTDISSMPNTQLSIDTPRYMTYYEWLMAQDSTVWDIPNDDAFDNIDIDQAFCKHQPKKPNIIPYVSFNDLNNSKDAPYENKPKPTIEIGIAFEF